MPHSHGRLSQVDWEKQCEAYLRLTSKRGTKFHSNQDLTGPSLLPVHHDTLAAARSSLENVNAEDILSDLKSGCCMGLSYLWAVFFDFNKARLWNNLLNCTAEWDGLAASLSMRVQEDTPYTLYRLFDELISLNLYIKKQFKKPFSSNLFRAKSHKFKLVHNRKTYEVQHGVCYAGCLRKKDMNAILAAHPNSGIIILNDRIHTLAVYVNRSKSYSEFILYDPTNTLKLIKIRDAAQLSAQIFSKLTHNIGVQFVSVDRVSVDRVFEIPSFKGKPHKIATLEWLDDLGLYMVASLAPDNLTTFFKMVQTDNQQEQIVRALCQRHPKAGWLTLRCMIYHAPNEASAWLDFAQTSQQKKQIIDAVCSSQSLCGTTELQVMVAHSPQRLSLILQMIQEPDLVEYFLKALCKQQQPGDISPSFLKIARAAIEKIAPHFEEPNKKCEVTKNSLTSLFRLALLDPNLITLPNIMKIISNPQLQQAIRAAEKYLSQTLCIFGFKWRSFGKRCMWRFVIECLSKDNLTKQQLEKAANSCTKGCGIFRSSSSMRREGSRINALVIEQCCSHSTTCPPV